MKKCCFVAALLLVSALSATGQVYRLPDPTGPTSAMSTTVVNGVLKALTIGRLTYIGDSQTDGSAFTLTLDTTDTGHTTPLLAAPITFSSFTWTTVGQNGTRGPNIVTQVTDGGVAIVTPQEWLFFTGGVDEGAYYPCPCLGVLLQLVIQTNPIGQPTVTITLKDGNTITTSSIVNVYLTAPIGMTAIQLQQYARVTLHAVE